MNVIESQDRISDADLLASYRTSRSSQPLEELLRRYYGFILAVCRRELHDSDLARDATQEVVLEFVKRADRLEAKPSIASWLFRVSQSRSRDIQRSEARRRKRDADSLSQVGPDTEDIEVHIALKSLAKEERDMLLARYIGDYSFEEIGHSYNLSPDAVRMRVNRTLDRLKTQLTSAALLLRLDQTLTNEPTPAPPILVPPSRLPISTRLLPLTAALVGSFATVALISKPFASPSNITSPVDFSGSVTSSIAAQNQVDYKVILPFYAEVESSMGDTCRYWRTEDGIRAIESRGEKQIHLRVMGKENLSMVVLPTPPGPNEGRIVLGVPGQQFIQTDAWEVMLLQLPVIVHTPSSPMRPWMLQDAIKDLSDREVQVSHPDGKRIYRVWLDSKRGNMPSKCEYVCKSSAETEFRFAIQVKEWQQVGNRWFPKKVERKSFFNGKPSYGVNFTLRNIRLGKDVPQSPAMPKPARNAIVFDENRKVWYLVNENWKRLSKETPTRDVSVGG